MNFLLTVSELRAFLENGVSPTIIDVRMPEAYKQGHLPGAINIPGDRLQGAMDQIPTDHPIITYCNMYNPGNSGSEGAAEILRDAGLHARALRGGYPAWQEAGYSIDILEHPIQDSTQQHKD